VRDDGERETGRAGRGARDIENGRPRRPRVLVAEDERDVAELIRHHLTKDGYDAVLFELLATLVGTPGRVFRRDELLDLVWGRDGFVEPRTVDVHMARLRAKFLDAKVDLPGVETVRGVGYRFREADAARL
jgi:two-component system, OmpR family, phosphate regulon response regulator PhoB